MTNDSLVEQKILQIMEIYDQSGESQSIEDSQSKAILSILLSLINDHFLTAAGEQRIGATDLILELLFLLVENRPDVYFSEGHPLVVGFLFRIFPLLSQNLTPSTLSTVAKLITSLLHVLCDRDPSPFLVLFQDFQLLLSDLDLFHRSSTPHHLPASQMQPPSLVDPLSGHPVAPSPLLSEATPLVHVLAFETLRHLGQHVAFLADLFGPGISLPLHFAVASLRQVDSLFTNVTHVLLRLLDATGLFLQSEVASLFSSSLSRLYTHPLSVKLLSLQLLEKCLSAFPFHASQHSLSLYLCAVLGLADEVSDLAQLALLRPTAFDDALAHLIYLLIADESHRPDFLSLSLNWLHLIEVNLLRTSSQKLFTALVSTIHPLLLHFPSHPRLFEVSSQLLVTILRERPPALSIRDTSPLLSRILFSLCHHYMSASAKHHASLVQFFNPPSPPAKQGSPSEPTHPLSHSATAQSNGGDPLPSDALLSTSHSLLDDEHFHRSMDSLFSLFCGLQFEGNHTLWSCARLAILFPSFYVLRNLAKSFYDFTPIWTKFHDAIQLLSRQFLPPDITHMGETNSALPPSWYSDACALILGTLCTIFQDPQTHTLDIFEPLEHLQDFILAALFPPPALVAIFHSDPLSTLALATFSGLCRFVPLAALPLSSDHCSKLILHPDFLSFLPQLLIHCGFEFFVRCFSDYPRLDRSTWVHFPLSAWMRCLGNLLCVLDGTAHIFGCCSIDPCNHQNSWLAEHPPVVLCTICDAARLERSPATLRHFRLSFNRSAKLKRVERPLLDEHSLIPPADLVQDDVELKADHNKAALVDHPIVQLLLHCDFLSEPNDILAYLTSLDRVFAHIHNSSPNIINESARSFSLLGLKFLTHHQHDIRAHASKVVLNHCHQLLLSSADEIAIVFDALEGLLVNIHVLTTIAMISELICQVFLEVEDSPQPIDSFQYYLTLSSILERSVIALLTGLIQPIPQQKAVSYRLLDALSHKRFPAARQDSLLLLMGLFQDAVYPFLIERLIDTPESFHEIVVLLEHQSLPHFFSKALPLALPGLMLSSDESTLKKLDQYIESLFRVVVENLQFILCQVLMRDPPDYLADSRIMHTLQKLTKYPCFTLYKTCHTDILFLLVSKLSIEPERARRGLERLFEILSRRADPHHKHNNPVALLSDGESGDSQFGTSLSEYLSNFFLALMGGITTRIEEVSNAFIMQKASLLRSLSLLFEIVGSGIHIHRPKISSTLNNLLRAPGPLQALALDAWFAFIKQLQPSELGPILPQIVADLLSYFDTAKDSLVATPSLPQDNHLLSSRVLAILQYLFVDQRSCLMSYYHSVPFLPSWPLFTTITLWQSEEHLDFLEQIDRLLACLSRHLNNNIREWTLTKLRELLDEYRSDIHFLIQSAHPIITRLVRELLNCSSYSHNTVRTRFLSAVCFGVLGAIDPVAVDEYALTPSQILFRKTTQEMTIELIRDFLVPALHGLERLEQDRSALAIQELLKAAGCTTRTPANVDNQGSNSSPSKAPFIPLDIQVWKAFPEEIRGTILPYLSSHYFSPPSTETPRFPICPRVHDYQRWLGEWTLILINQSTGKKASTFQACRSVVKANTQVAMYLLPYLVLNVLKNGRDGETIHTEILAVLDDQKSTPCSPSRTSVSFVHNCRQAVFTLIDFLISWVDVAERVPAKDQNKREKRREKLNRVKFLMDNVSPLMIARASHNCKADGRALLHFERFLRSAPLNERHSKLIAEFPLYLDIYNSLDEPDGLSGIATLASHMSSTQAELFAHENAGRWSEALAYYNGLLVEHPDSVNHQAGLLRCVKNLGHLESLVCLLRGFQHQNAHHRRAFLPQSFQQFGAFAAWRLGNPMLISEFIPDIDERTHNFEIGLAQIFRGIASGEQHLGQIIYYYTSLLARSLAISSTESYIRSYANIAKLEILQDISDAIRLFIPPKDAEAQKAAFSALRWEQRLANVQQLYKFREPVLSCQIALLRFGGDAFERDIGTRQIDIAKVARKEGLFQTAFSAVIQASHSKLEEIKFQAQVELVKLERIRGERDQALRAVREIIQTRENTPRSPEMALPYLIHGQLLAETGHSSFDEVISQFETAIQCRQDWEKGFFTLGQFYDRLMLAAKSMTDTKMPMGRFDVSLKRSCEYLTPVIHNYGEALKYGHSRIYQSMPRMLTLWFEYNALMHSPNPPPRDDKIMDKAIEKANQAMNRLARTLPPQLWLACLSQLVSRICHPDLLVWGLLKDILVAVLRAYPGQAPWFLMAVTYSADDHRKSRASEIMTQVSTHDTIKNTVQLAEKLIQLAKEPIVSTGRIKKLKIASLECRSILTLAQNTDIILPLENQLRPIFSPLSSNQHVFPAHITLQSMSDECELMSSQVAPRKITFIGSDGKEYWFLCKPKDDLRKDARMMEFNHLINHLLKKNPESRRRKLHIRTYSVIPLDEANGLIEWVPHTSCFRHILNEISSHRPDENARARSIWSTSRVSPSERFRLACAEVPPKFYKWFIQNFPQHNRWFASRLEYARTTAVISMVGTIVGLGDRHTENLLFSVDDGAIVSIDLNCLFWKGWQFKDPERVPFRLTPQMVDALGPTGYEGVFRRVCEITLGVIRSNRETLMTVLETFLYDPLLEWKADFGRPKRAQHRSTDRLTLPRGESPNAEAKGLLTKVDKIISGEYGAYFPLSIEGQVDKLIKEATDPAHLGVMYLGWAAWL